MSDDALRDIISASTLCTLATVRRNGRPQLSQVGYAYDRERDLLRVSVTASRAKTANLRRDPRGTVLVQGAGRWAYAVGEVRAELWDVTTDPQTPARTSSSTSTARWPVSTPTGTSSGRR